MTRALSILRAYLAHRPDELLDEAIKVAGVFVAVGIGMRVL